MPQTKDKVLPLGKPRATKYLEIIEKRDGKRKAAAVEKKARELAAAEGSRVVRFEFVAEAAGITLDQMAAELAEHGIRTSPSNVRHGTLNGTAKTKAKTETKTTKKTARAKPAAKDGPGNARKATASKKASPKPTASSSSSKSRDAVKPDPKPGARTATGSGKRNGSSRKRAGSRGPAAGSSLSKAAQTRQLREKQASTRS